MLAAILSVFMTSFRYSFFTLPVHIFTSFVFFQVLARVQGRIDMEETSSKAHPILSPLMLALSMLLLANLS